MLMQEVCKQCGLTKKAVEYYVAQRLVQPMVLENGYRDFSAADVERLKKVAVLRRLGLPVQSIREVLDGQGRAALSKAAERKGLEIEADKARLALVRQLAATQDWTQTVAQLESLEQSQTILQRLLDVFPGYYGQYVSLHFAQFLREPIVSDEQRVAFRTVVDFLDNAAFELPPELEAYLDEIAGDADESFVERVSASMHEMIADPGQYIAENQAFLEQYMALKASDEFRNSPAYRLQEHLKKLNRENGYDDVFIPAMKKLSPSYRQYHDGLVRANEIFLQKYPAMKR